MKPPKFFFLLLLATIFACRGQNAPEAGAVQPALELGDTVPALSKDIWYIFQASNGDYWFGSASDGAYRYDGKVLLYFSAADGLGSGGIRGIQEDKKGQIFFTTLAGISKFDGQSFQTLEPVIANGPEEHWALQADDLWFSTLGKEGEQGPSRYDGEKLYQLQFPKHHLADAYFAEFPDKPWSPYDVYSIYRDRKGQVWFGTSNFGVGRYDGKSLGWLYEDHLTNTPEGGSFGIRSILEDAEGKYWFCNNRFRYDIAAGVSDADGKALLEYRRSPGIRGLSTARGADHIYFFSVVEDAAGDLWMVTYDEGVWRYDGQSVTHYPVKKGTKDLSLFSLYQDRKGELWVGTHEAGVYKFDGTNFVPFVL
ncbi:two-component regulator propeller domain-containing protein [Neolewinella lacunae]|uniref:Uncharacterized protein n=1 Tax=Neolewinella lacunae TaxID=1517758 RepID=A0A923PIV0_9BACT|nr:two-component regulator propeller domain-containing protein [Neolewinella lacunae]MBC6993395.1 hypothetical protein [Neolewinella lacunae]MDN3635147.1 two-component regulator propeller domain-containing protein [Neolewinella lacunae]